MSYTLAGETSLVLSLSSRRFGMQPLRKAPLFLNPTRCPRSWSSPRNERFTCSWDCPRQQRNPRACTSAATPQPLPPVRDMAAAITRLGHIEQSERKQASNWIAANASDTDVAELLRLLQGPDSQTRRSAVDALGMTGARVVPALADTLLQGEGNARGGAAQALSRMCAYEPGLRADFAPSALDALEKAVRGDVDPVVRLHATSCLGILGSDTVGKDRTSAARHAGNELALAVLEEACSDLEPGGLAASAVMAITQIARTTRSDRRAHIKAVLTRLAVLEHADPESGVQYIRQMAKSCLAQMVDMPYVANNDMEM